MEGADVHEIVNELVHLIETHGWKDRFNEAIRMAASYKIPAIAHIKTLQDYLDYIDGLVTWTPIELVSTELTIKTNLYDHFVKLYFFLDQPPVRALQVEPGIRPEKLTPLSEWIVRYADQWGDYLDTTESARHVKTFKCDPKFNWDEYMPPPSSHAGEEDWLAYRTFNQFFARHVKPGMRPIAGLTDPGIIVSPTDSTPVGCWRINHKSEIFVTQEKDGLVTSKGIVWSIHELLADSAFADRFKGGIFTHSALTTYDYHRWHTPVQGRVLEAKVIKGQAYLDVTVGEAIVGAKKTKVLAAQDGTGYQFVQTRGLVVIDSPIGLVACLPIGMAQVSSVVITAEVGVTLHKGEELGYFQFGGSDFVMVFERASNVQLVSQPGVHVNQGSWIGNAFPYRA
ncbi:phosphatidylserine decarboxylase [uncultured Rhodoblastus sp.]|uniref:phosphatidylserine decarboxylase n=1 Tax=uncultured Rhodoblastus sp. TaxID=543037 RepID=UPI0025FBF88A|nr:phosphatidylserine decarboxylase [uncultured Rhodoblastus sp.]